MGYECALVSFHADHGWQLGEHGEWRKMTNFELGVRVPLMIRAPWKAAGMGKRSSALVELVDMYSGPPERRSGGLTGSSHT